MSKNVESKSIDQLLAEADELVQQINTDTLKDLKEEHRLQVEIHAQHLKKIKSAVQDKIEKKGTSNIDHGAEGMHEAFQEISKAIGELKKYLSGDRTGAVK
jgi:wobble nucleotide-excising tRNase